MSRINASSVNLLGCVLAVVIGLALVAPVQGQVNDPYEIYIKTSRDFKPVKQDKAWALKAFPSWTYMPWYANWSIGFNDAGGEFCQKVGINGAFVDHGDMSDAAWITKYNLRFYGDHTAGKGDLHMWDGGGAMKPYQNQIHGTGVRIKPVNDAMKTKLEGVILRNISKMKVSPLRQAYALDDEISWGHFVHPCMWCVTDDASAYPAWLKSIYGEANVPQRNGWIDYNDILGKLPTLKVKDFDASQLMDQWTFNDSYWNNFIGDLVDYANTVDADTPCGYEGGQGANAFGGYDLAKMMRKVQFMESYSGASLIRSFNPHNALPIVTTHFVGKSGDPAKDTIWQVWYNLAHGNKGLIGWVEGWFDGKTPKPWLEQVAPTYLQVAKKIGPMMTGSEWIHDGVAIYYNHASVQLGWIMDAQAHGKTWINRNSDSDLGASHKTKKAWEAMLIDDGLQFNYINYADLVQNGVPAEYKVLILPATLCLSDVEARKIKEFCKSGGTVIADYMPGLWDQHGKGRVGGGVLDDMFGVKHDTQMSAADVFQGGKLWAEVDQESHYTYNNEEEFLSNNGCIKDASGFNKAVRNMEVSRTNKFGAGTAVLMNLSPQWYNVYHHGTVADAAAKRNVFTQYVKKALPNGGRWVEIQGAGDKENGYEITYWKQGNKTIIFLLFKPDITAGSESGGNSVGLKSDQAMVTLAFHDAVSNVKDERNDKVLGDGKAFKVDWAMNEAVVLSFIRPGH